MEGCSGIVWQEVVWFRSRCSPSTHCQIQTVPAKVEIINMHDKSETKANRIRVLYKGVRHNSNTKIDSHISLYLAQSAPQSMAKVVAVGNSEKHQSL